MKVFRRNLSLLKKCHYDLYCKLNAHHSKMKVERSVDNIDLLVDGEKFYGIDANVACSAQVDEFAKSPVRYSMHYENNKKFFSRHQSVINRLNNLFDGFIKHKKPDNKLNTLIVLGAGLGFHIEDLFQRFTIKNIILIEPSDDMLLHCLECLDFAKIKQKCESRNGFFSILQPSNLESFSGQMMYLARSQGFGLMSDISVFRHYHTDLLDDIFTNIVSMRNRWFSGWGFFDDEITGLKNTLTNVLHGEQFYSKEENFGSPKGYAIIVGNGPSLDENLDDIKAVQNYATIVSCGTSLVPLLKVGIIPDIHVEMERGDTIFESLEYWLTPEVTNKTTLFALNTVSPKEVSIFKNSYLFSKANDLGALVLKKSKLIDQPPLYYCNPTVTNFALSACISVGWENIVLLGCDYGCKDIKRHHSSYSDFYNPNSILAKVVQNNEIFVKGNFGENVYTNKIYNNARKNIEKIISNNNSINVFNGSDGAAIAGAKVIKFSALFDEMIKFKKREGFCFGDGEKCFLPITSEPLSKEFLFSQKTIKALIKDIRSAKSVEEISNFLRLASFNVDVKGIEDPAYFLLSGVLRIFHAMISGHVLRLKNSDKNRYYIVLKEEVISYFYHCNQVLIKLNQEILSYEIQSGSSASRRRTGINVGESSFESS
ncbi:MAG: motility associated factor glycosyltransferase family protein [Cellvibrionaceae bacterium]